MDDLSKQIEQDLLKQLEQQEQQEQLSELFQILDSLNLDDNNFSSNNNNNNINYQDKTEDFNQDIIRKGLLPELKENEKQKRSLKPKLMRYIVCFIFVHSIIMLALLTLLVCAVTLDVDLFKDINIDVLKELSKFMMFFITESLAEFIGMLLVIVHYIFDKSIVKLIGDFNLNNKDNKNNHDTNRLKSIENKLLNTKKLLKDSNNKRDMSIPMIQPIDDEDDDEAI